MFSTTLRVEVNWSALTIGKIPIRLINRLLSIALNWSTSISQSSFRLATSFFKCTRKILPFA